MRHLSLFLKFRPIHSSSGGAIVAGVLISLLTERGEIFAYWRKEEIEGG